MRTTLPHRGTCEDTARSQPNPDGCSAGPYGFVTLVVVRAEPHSFRGTERYLIAGPLGAGAMGVVFRAHDRDRGETVALKLLKQFNPLALYRFKREFRALADVVHRNLVPLYELSSAGDDWFFTMQLVDGVDFLEFVRGHAAGSSDYVPELATATCLPIEATITGGMTADTKQLVTATPERAPETPDALLPPGAYAAVRSGVRAPPIASEEQYRRLRAALCQLAVGIQVLHRHGTLHRDIKPPNVLVDRDERLVLLDFGVVTELAGRQAALDAESRVVGTPAYMAPEVGTERTLTEASDWYGVGVMLYEALTGTRPFQGEWRALLELKRTTDAPAPALLSPTVPPELDSLCRALLCRDPEVRATGRDILRACGEESAPSRAASAPVPADAVALVGRDHELSLMRRGLDFARDGVASAMFVHGASGMGKSVLVQRFCDDVAAEGAIVLSGRCYERESVPYKALDSLMDCLANTLLELPTQVVQKVLPPDALALARLFPVLRRVEAVLGGETRVLEVADPHEQRRLAIAALRELLATLSTLAPIVIHIDDLQWGDTDSAALLADVLRPPSPPPVLLVASYRDDSEQVGPFIERLDESMERTCDVPVTRLSPEQARRLARSLLASVSAREQFAEAIADESEGSPFFVTELARYVANRPPGVSFELSLHDLLETRILELSPPARALLDVIAVSGRPVLQRVALRATDLVDDARSAVIELRHAHLVRTRGARDEDPIEAYHDRIRETAYARLDDDTLRACHLRVAYALQASGAADAEELGVHFERSGDSQRAGQLYVEAAASAAAQLAFDRCGHLYERAIELIAPEGQRRSELFARAADAYSNAGRGADSARAYRAAADSSERAVALRYRGRACEELLRSGHVSEGVASMRDVLAEVGLTLPRGRTNLLLTLAWLRARIRLRGLGYRERDASQITLEDLTRIEVCWAAGMALGMSDHMMGTALQARHLLHAMRTGERHHVTRALALEAVFSSLGGGKTTRRTDKVGRRVLSLADELGDPLSGVWAKGSRAFALYQRGDWPEALEFALAALEHVRGEAGMWWERTSMNLYMLWSQYWLGQLGDLADRVPALLRDADTRGDLYSYTNFALGFPAMAWLVRDDPDGWLEIARRAMQRWSRDAYHLQHYWYMIARCHRHLYLGDGRAAYELVCSEWPLLEKNFVLSVEMVWIESVHLRGRAAIAAAAAEPAERAKLLRSARRDARRLERRGRVHAGALATTLRAGIAAVDGSETATTVALLHRAETASETASTRLFAAIARRYRGLLVGGDEGEQLVTEAEADIDAQQIVDRDRMCRTLIPGFDGADRSRSSVD